MARVENSVRAARSQLRARLPLSSCHTFGHASPADSQWQLIRLNHRAITPSGPGHVVLILPQFRVPRRSPVHDDGGGHRSTVDTGSPRSACAPEGSARARTRNHRLDVITQPELRRYPRRGVTLTVEGSTYSFVASALVSPGRVGAAPRARGRPAWPVRAPRPAAQRGTGDSSVNHHVPNGT